MMPEFTSEHVHSDIWQGDASWEQYRSGGALADAEDWTLVATYISTSAINLSSFGAQYSLLGIG